jgi:hypothetical protein
VSAAPRRKGVRKRTPPQLRATARRARPEEEESAETAHEREVAISLYQLGIHAGSVLYSELTAELEVRIYLVRKRLGDAAPKDAWSAQLLREHAPTFEDIPELIEKVPFALRAQSVISLIQELRARERTPLELRGPPYLTSAPPGSLPKILKRYAHPHKARRALLARIGRAIANVRPWLTVAASLVLAPLEEIEARALEMPRGQRNKRRAELARDAGFDGATDANVLAAFRLELRRARRRASLRPE